MLRGGMKRQDGEYIQITIFAEKIAAYLNKDARVIDVGCGHGVGKETRGGLV